MRNLRRLGRRRNGRSNFYLLNNVISFFKEKTDERNSLNYYSEFIKEADDALKLFLEKSKTERLAISKLVQ